MPSSSAGSRSRKRMKMAQTADRHQLYEDAVQCAEAEIDFVDDTYHALRGRRAKWLREDFGGTANTSCEWVRRRRTNHAIAVDLDADVQQWGREHHIASLSPQARKRIRMVTDDVVRVDCGPVDIVLAMNFSYWCFKTRELLKSYFRHVHKGLADDGLFMLDAYGGSDAHREMKDYKKLDRFTYVWEQKSYNPINGDFVCHIHFNFPDGSKMADAFAYDWRLWTLPEIREILIEAGFKSATVYWEGTDEDTNEGDGVFAASEQGEADDVFVVYLVAEK